MSLHSLPLFVRMDGRPVILLGDGEAAEAKQRLLKRAGARIVGEGANATLAIVAIENESEALAAVARLKARGVLVNAVDRPEHCDFTLPAIVERGPVIVAVGTGGVSAGLAAALRQRLEGWLSPRLGELAEFLQDARSDLKAAFPRADDRRKAISRALAPGGPLDLTDPFLEDPFWISDVESGSDWEISYVRLHSPDPDEMTLRTARLLATADRVTHRANVPSSILDRARADAVRIECAVRPTEAPRGLTVDVEMT